MKELQIIKRGNQLVTDSREVAEMVERQHKELMRDIRHYCEVLNERKIAPVDFFIESTYTDNKGEARPCFLITRKGCDMVANKMTGEKGIVFTAQYVTQFEEMEKTITKKHFDELKERRVAVMQQNARSREAALWLKIGNNVPTPEYKQICASYASKTLAGLAVLPLPVMEQQYYTAQEVGTRIGITGNMVGRIANAHGLKAPQGQANKYGRWFWDKAKHCSKEVPTWKYTDDGANAIEKFFKEEKSCFM